MPITSSGRARALALVSTAFTTLAAGAAHAQAVLPSGGTVAAGGARIATNGTTTTIKQSTDRAVIDWRGFDVGAGHGVVFAQPGSGSATLNRVTGTTGSTIAGSITSNGAVYLVNPNGIAITATGNVQTGGGFVASTLDIADAEFMGGKLGFAGVGGAVSNAGRISAGSGAYVALLGGAVSNGGVISVPTGKVGLGAGAQITLDLNGDGFLQVAPPAASVTTGGLADAKGRVQLGVGQLRQALRAVVNLPDGADAVSATSARGGITLGGAARIPVTPMIAPAPGATSIKMSGTINVDSASGHAGRIELIGAGGTVTATGTLSARATGATGDGGVVETSGAQVNFAGLKTDTRAAHGLAGTWLIDPTDLTVDSAAAATISSNLASGNVTLQTSAHNPPIGPGNPSAGNGDININSAIGWTSANTLTLTAYNNINLAAAITGTAGGLTLSSGNAVANAGAISGTAPLSVGIFNLTNGVWTQNLATLPTFAATDFRFSPRNATFLRVTGGTGASATPYGIADVYGLQGIASPSLLGNNFALANSIDASVTAGWNAGAGFLPIGTDGTGKIWSSSQAGFYAGSGAGFSGSLTSATGSPLVIQNLTINRYGIANEALFGYSSGNASLTNIALTNVTVLGGDNSGGLLGQGTGKTLLNNDSTSGSIVGYSSSASGVGGLVGFLQGGSVANSYSTANVSGSSAVGGLVGSNGGSISNSHATGNARGGDLVGGLIGDSNGTVTFANVYATGDVNGSNYAGGLIGRLNGGTLTASHATGSITTDDTTAGSYVGGLVGYASGSVSSSYASGAVTNAAGDYIGGLIGFSAATVSGSSASGNVTGAHSVGGLIGYTTTVTSGSSASGNVSGTSYAGGLIGLAGAPVSGSSASGNVTATTSPELASMMSNIGF